MLKRVLRAFILSGRIHISMKNVVSKRIPDSVRYSAPEKYRPRYTAVIYVNVVSAVRSLSPIHGARLVLNRRHVLPSPSKSHKFVYALR